MRCSSGRIYPLFNLPALLGIILQFWYGAVGVEQSGWAQGIATQLSGLGLEIVRNTGSCGYGPIGPESWPGVAIAQIASINAFHDLPSTCGLCIEVKYGGASVVVQIIDVCSSCHKNEITLLQPQLYSLSSGSSAQTDADDIRILYRQVPCQPDPNYYHGGLALRVDGYKQDGSWLRLQPVQARLPLAAISVQTSTEAVRAFEGDMAASAPVSMYRTWGASWELVGVPTPPLDFTLTDISGTTVIARNVAVEPGTAGLYPTGVQFPAATTSPSAPTPGPLPAMTQAYLPMPSLAGSAHAHVPAPAPALLGAAPLSPALRSTERLPYPGPGPAPIQAPAEDQRQRAAPSPAMHVPFQGTQKTRKDEMLAPSPSEYIIEGTIAINSSSANSPMPSPGSGRSSNFTLDLQGQIKQGQIPSGPLVLPAAPAPTPAGTPLLTHVPVVAPAAGISAATSQHALGTRPEAPAPAAALALQRPGLGPGAAPEPGLAPRPAQGQASGSAAPAAPPQETQEGTEMQPHAPAARCLPHPAAAAAAGLAPREAPSPTHQPVGEAGSIPQHHRLAPSAGPVQAGSSPQRGAAAVAAGMVPSSVTGPSQQPSDTVQRRNQGHAPEPEMAGSVAAVEAPLVQRSFTGAPAGYPACPPCTCPSAWAPAAGPSATALLVLPTEAAPPRTHPIKSVSMVRAPEPHEGEGGGEAMAQPAASAPGPERPAQKQPPPPPSQLRAAPDPSFSQQAPGYGALAPRNIDIPSRPSGTNEYLQRAPDIGPLPIAAMPPVPFPVTAPSPMQSSEGLQHGLAAVAGSRARPPAIPAGLAAAPAGAAAAGPGGQAGQPGNATTTEPLHARSLAPAIQEGTLDLHGNGTLVHSSSISAPSPLPAPLWMSTARPSSNLSLASFLG